MQNQSETGAILYTERADDSGFIIREVPGTLNPRMRFQAGYFVSRPSKDPEYVTQEILDSKTGKPAYKAVFSHHIIGGNLQYFFLHGSGRTKEEAITNASNKLIRADIAAGI